MKITNETKIKEYLEDAYTHQPEFKLLNPDYTFGEFWNDMKTSAISAIEKLGHDDEEWLRGILSKICYVSASKFRWSQHKFEDSLPIYLQHADDLLKKILTWLIDKKNYYIAAHDTHRWISSDGWYELEYNLRNDSGTDVYLTTYSSHDQDFEDEWSSEDEHHISPDEMYMNDWKDDPLWIMSNLAGSDKVKSDIPNELLDEMMRRLKNRFPDNY